MAQCKVTKTSVEVTAHLACSSSNILDLIVPNELLVHLTVKHSKFGTNFGEYLMIVEGSHWDHFYGLNGMYDRVTLSLGS